MSAFFVDPRETEPGNGSFRKSAEIIVSPALADRKMEYREKNIAPFRLVLNVLTIYIALTLWIAMTWRCFSECQVIGCMYFDMEKQAIGYNYILYSPLLAVPVLFLFAFKIHSFSTLRNAVFPIFSLVPFLYLPLDIFSVIIYIAVTGVATTRLLAVGCEKILVSAPRIRLSLWIGALSAIAALLALFAFNIYATSWKQLCLLFPDWGIFLEVAQNTVNGEFLKSYWLGETNFFSDHFMPGFFMLLIPLIWAFPSPYTIMILGVTLLFGSSILIFFFARLKGLSDGCAFLMALIYLLNPSLTNMNLSLFYGFHENLLFVPVLILFYMAYERGSGKTAFCVFLYSLTIKEVLAAFWVGWACCAFFSGKRRTAFLYFAVSCAYMLICMKLITPAFSTADNPVYKYNAEYAHLGSGVIEILKSPFTRPEIFFSCIFTVKNLTFCLLLLLPIFIAVFSSGVVMFSSAFLLLFLMLTGNQEKINLLLHYQAETVAMLNIAATLGIARVIKNNDGVWRKILYSKLPKTDGRATAIPILCGVFVTALLSHCFFTQTYYGKSAIKQRLINKNFDASGLMNEVKAVIPKGSKVGAPPFAASMLLTHARTCKISYPNCDYYLTDIGRHHFESSEEHVSLLKNPNYGLVWMGRHNEHSFYIFRKGEKNRFPNPLKRLNDKEWENAGLDIKVNDPAFAIKAQLKKTEASGMSALLVSVRVMNTTNALRKVKARMTGDVGDIQFSVPFGFGVVAPEAAQVGDVFTLTLPIPANWKSVKTVQANVVPIGE